MLLRVQQIPGVPIMYIANRKYSIERMPEAFGGAYSRGFSPAGVVGPKSAWEWRQLTPRCHAVWLALYCSTEDISPGDLRRFSVRRVPRAWALYVCYMPSVPVVVAAPQPEGDPWRGAAVTGAAPPLAIRQKVYQQQRPLWRSEPRFRKERTRSDELASAEVLSVEVGGF